MTEFREKGCHLIENAQAMTVMGVIWVAGAFLTNRGTYNPELQVLIDSPKKRPSYSGLGRSCPNDYFRKTTSVVDRKHNQSTDVNVCFKILSHESIAPGRSYIEFKFRDSDTATSMLLLDSRGYDIEADQDPLNRLGGKRYVTSTLSSVNQNLTRLLNDNSVRSEPDWTKQLGWIKDEANIPRDLQSSSWSHWRTYVLDSLEWSAGGVVIGWLLMVAAGWVVRGFLGIPLGRDSKT